MAYVNVVEWKTDQVCEWLKGLDNSVLPYVHSFMNHNVNGQQLLNLRPEDLEHLGLFKLGHQEIILEAVEYLRNFHYELDRENLQLLAIHLSCQTWSLYNELLQQTDDTKPVSTQALSDVVAIITVVKPLIRWLDRPPFSGQLDYNDKKAELLKLSLEMATCAQRDRFAEKPIEEIRTTCCQMANLADNIIQDIADPMILQPSSLDLATLKKKPGDDLGFCILPSFHGAHQIAEIKFGSAAHQCGKMEEGDEIVQVNYQTIVGWERKNVLELFRESPAEILLTIKRRPRHTKVYGQIYIKPYRLPSNKKTPYATRWQNNLPSPRPEFLTIPEFTMPLPRHNAKVPTLEPVCIRNNVSILDTIATDDSSESDSEIEIPSLGRLYSSKPRNFVQRRATITGASPTSKHSIDIEQFWRELKQEHRTSFLLRDKAASCAHGLDSVQATVAVNINRPQTYLGLEQRSHWKKNVEETMNDKKVQFQESTKNIVERHKRGNKDQIPAFIKNFDQCCSINDDLNDINLQLESLNIRNNNTSYKKVPSENTVFQNSFSNPTNDNHESLISTQMFRDFAIKERSRLDKSYSTPAYDLNESDDDFIEKKFEAALDEHHKQQQKARTQNSYSTSFRKTDSRLFDSIEDLEEHCKPLKCYVKDSDLDTSKVIGNVAKKISDFEKNLQINSLDKMPEEVHSKSSSNSDTSIVNIRIKISDAEFNNLNEIEADSGNKTTAVDYDKDNNLINDEMLNDEFKKKKSLVLNERKNISKCAKIGEIYSKKKSESTSSYNEGSTSCSSDMDLNANKTTDLEAISHVSQEQIKYISEENFEDYNINHQNLTYINQSSVNGQGQTIMDLSSSIEVKTETLVNNVSLKHTASSIATIPSFSHHAENTLPVSNSKQNVQPRQEPPEPPPRKYFMKHSSRPKFEENQLQLKPKVPTRPNAKSDLKKFADSPAVQPRDVKTSMDACRKNEWIETYSEVFEKSADFVDELSIPLSESKTSVAILDQYGYTEIPELDSKDLFSLASDSLNSNNTSTTEIYCKNETSQQNIDSADEICSHHQVIEDSLFQIDSKPRSLEKDKLHEKGVVSKARMVVRSMGLHSNLAKTNSSPKCTRKQNSILAKRRNIGVKEISFGDLEGWLTYRSRGAGGAWARAWFIIKGALLYRFKTQDSSKADCLIALTGFTASQANEVKSRKNAFKVYYAGTVFYFAADSDDVLTLWLDAINRATIGADRTSGIFTETDDSDGESKTKWKTSNSKLLTEKTFGSLKKFRKKDSGLKADFQESCGASLDRKYLKFLGTRSQNVPVPTAQFRSYRRVLPTSTPNRKLEKVSTPDLQVTIAGSTFYGLNASHSTTNVLASSQDMGDYRRTTDRSYNRSQRPEELQGFITLEEFMLSRQEEERQWNNTFNSSSHFTSFENDNVHFQHHNIADSAVIVQNNGMIYGSPRNGEYSLPPAPPPPKSKKEVASSSCSFDSQANSSSIKTDSIKSKSQIKSWESSGLRNKKPCMNNNYEIRQQSSPSLPSEEFMYKQKSVLNDNQVYVSTLDYGERLKPQPRLSTLEINNSPKDFHKVHRRRLQNEDHSSSGGVLACRTNLDTMDGTKKNSIVRKGSFNIADCRRGNHIYPNHSWIESLSSADKKSFKVDRGFLQNTTQYRSQHSPESFLNQDNVSLGFDLPLAKGCEQKKSTKGLRNFFGTKSPQKTNSLDLPKEQQKTVLGSPRLHRALFRDKLPHQRQNSRSESPSPGDSGINKIYELCSGTIHDPISSSINSDGDFSSSLPSSLKCMVGEVPVCQKKPNTRHPSAPPIFPYIPPPSSPPPDYPNLEYPPVFEPGTYSLSNASVLRHRSKIDHSAGD